MKEPERTQVIEIIARAVCVASGGNPDEMREEGHGSSGGPRWRLYANHGCVALSRLEDKGFSLVKG